MLSDEDLRMCERYGAHTKISDPGVLVRDLAIEVVSLRRALRMVLGYPNVVKHIGTQMYDEARATLPEHADKEPADADA